MARIEWVERRLENWALWKERRSSGASGYASQSIFADGPSARGHGEAMVPVDDIEASITDDAVESLKLGWGHLHQTLHLVYVKGLGIRETAERMHRAMSTIHAQLGQADLQLAAWFNERRRLGPAAAASLSVRAQLQAGESIALHMQKRDERRQQRRRKSPEALAFALPWPGGPITMVIAPPPPSPPLAPPPAPAVQTSEPEAPRRRRPILRIQGSARPSSGRDE